MFWLENGLPRTARNPFSRKSVRGDTAGYIPLSLAGFGHGCTHLVTPVGILSRLFRCGVSSHRSHPVGCPAISRSWNSSTLFDLELRGRLREKPWRPAHRCHHSRARPRFRRFAWLKTPGIPVIRRKYPSLTHSTPDGEIDPSS